MCSLPQWAHRSLLNVEDIGCDDDKLTREADFDDGLCGAAVERFTANDEFAFSRFGVALALDDLTGKDDVFEVNDREVVIVKFLCGMRGYDIVLWTNQSAKLRDQLTAHSLIVGCEVCRPGNPLLLATSPSQCR